MARAGKRPTEEEQLHLFVSPSSSEAPASQTQQVNPAPLSPDVEALAASLPATIRLGTSSWSFPGWEGLIYDRPAPQTTLSREGLPLYSRHPLLRTVGVDRTYYRPMTAAQFADYAAQVPESFRFLVKAHEYCTLAGFGDHPRYGTRRGQSNSLFLDPHYATQEVIGPFMDGLKDKAGPLLFQFSPQDHTSLAGSGSFVERLYQFLDRLPRGPVYAVELRNSALFNPRVCGCLICGRYVSLPEWPSRYAAGSRASRPGSTGTESGACRPLDAGAPSELPRPQKQKYAPFNRIVDADPMSRQAIAELCLESSVRQQPSYVIVNNKAEGCAPLSIVQLARQIVETESDAGARGTLNESGSR